MLEEREAQVTDLEERIQAQETRHRACADIRHALTVGSGAVELARAPGKGASLEEARAELLRAELLLPRAANTQLQQDVKDLKHRVELTVQFLQEMEDGDAELCDARTHVASGQLDLAQECAQTALQVFQRLDVSISIEAALLLLSQVSSMHVCAKGEEELLKGEEALGDDETQQAHAHACAARDLFEEAGAADRVVAAREVLRRILEAKDRDATVEKGTALLAEAEVAIKKADFAFARRTLSHARAAFLRAAMQGGEQEVDEMEHRLDATEAAGAAVREAKQAVAEAQQVLAAQPPDALAAKFAAIRARSALERGVDNVAACCTSSLDEVREVTSLLEAAEQGIAALLHQQSANATLASLIQNARTCLDKEQLDEAEEVLAQARHTLATHDDPRADTLQHIVDMQEELRVVREEMRHRQEGEALLEEAEAGLRAVDLPTAEQKAQVNSLSVFVSVYMYIYVCVCVCVYVSIYT